MTSVTDTDYTTQVLCTHYSQDTKIAPLGAMDFFLPKHFATFQIISLDIEIFVCNFIPGVPQVFWFKYAFLSERLKGDK